ncbi:MAG: hypothetical protein EON93_02155 [Burkholderiales bacterium]|nr:MAG: hypothetical protein EON93_02155 [Burkholderiales bacterium]
MVRARNLNDGDIAEIVSMLDGWAGSLTWDALIEEIERRLRVRYTRQALHKHARVADAFALRKKTLSGSDGAPTPAATSPELQFALERVARLEAENQRLEAENNRLLEQYARWAYNANVKGISIEILSRPLPPLNRGRTDGSRTGSKPTRVK